MTTLNMDTSTCVLPMRAFVYQTCTTHSIHNPFLHQGTSHYAIQRKAVVNPNDIDRESLQRGLLDAEYLHEHIEDGLDDGALA